MSLPNAAGTVRLSPRLLAPLPDNRLVDEVRRGNEAAFEVIYDRHHRALLAFCRHMLGSQEESEDAVQQTFVSAYRDLAGSEKPIKLKAWLYTIARNRCLSILRARREEAAELADIPTAGLSDAVVEREELRRLLADVRSLPEDQRAALVLSELGDLSHAEIAGILECETVQVKALVFQARSSLIASRQAADVPCHEIRGEIATARGAALRRGVLRRHIKACPACAAFRDDVRRQRQLFALALPVVPTLALKNSVLTAARLGQAATGGAAGGGAIAGCTGASGGAAAGGTAAGGAGIAAVGGTGGGGVLASIGALGGTKLAVLAVVAAGVAGGGVALDEVTISHHAASGAVSSTPAATGTAKGGPAGFGSFSHGLAHALAAHAGWAWGAASGWGAGKTFGKGKGHGKSGNSGQGKGSGHGHGAAPQSLQMQSGSAANGNGNAYGHANGGSSSGNGNGNAYGNGNAGGNGNGNAYGNSSGSTSPPAYTTAPSPNGNAYGVYGHPDSPGSGGQHGGGNGGNPGNRVGAGTGGGRG